MCAEFETLLSERELKAFYRLKETNKNLPEIAYGQWDTYEEIFYSYLQKVFKAYKPKLLYSSIGSPDVGHYSTYAQYALALKRADEIIYAIWEMIRTEPYYKDNTYLIVCVDHERDPYYMHHSDGNFETPRPVWCYLYGPGIKKGSVIGRPIKQMDIFATLARIMNVETHRTAGRVLEDSFQR
jgi:phosphopentomutase